jgi:hypothetical protein
MLMEQEATNRWRIEMKLAEEGVGMSRVKDFGLVSL